MAIVVEEQNNRGGVFTVVVWAIIIIVLGIGTYYVFFKTPPTTAVAPPAGFEGIQQISTISLKPDEILRSAEFLALRVYVTPTTPSSSGRPNPFLGF